MSEKTLEEKLSEAFYTKKNDRVDLSQLRQLIKIK